MAAGGPAGRRSGRSAAVLVASSAPLDQFVVRNPSYLFDAAPEHALINPDNLHILVDHVKCAAFELPFTPREQYRRHDLQEVLAYSRRVASFIGRCRGWRDGNLAVDERVVSGRCGQSSVGVLR